MKQPEKPEKWGKARPWILISAPAILKNKYFYFVAALFILALSIASGNGSMTVYYCGNILKDMDMMTPLSMALTLPVIIGNCFVPAIVKKIGHQKTLILSSILMLVGFLIVAINPHSGTFAIVGMVVRGFGNGAIFACGFALAAIASLPAYENLPSPFIFSLYIFHFLSLSIPAKLLYNEE